MAQSKTTRPVKNEVVTIPVTAQDKVAKALSHASHQAKKQLTAHGLKLPTQNRVHTLVSPATLGIG